MQTSARIALAICVVVLGTASAWLFRKVPESAPSAAATAENSASNLRLRESGGAALGSSPGDFAWRPAGPSRPPSKGRLASIGSGDLTNLNTPLLPIPHGLRQGAVIHPVQDRGGADSAGSAFGPDAADDDEPTLHVVSDGDTLPRLAKHYLGDTDGAAEIIAANREIIFNPEILPIGATLRIPRRLAQPQHRASAFPSVRGSGTPAEGGAWRKIGEQRP